MPENRINGYQIRYSLKSSMKQSKMVRVKGYKKSSAKIRKLQCKEKILFTDPNLYDSRQKDLL